MAVEYRSGNASSAPVTQGFLQGTGSPSGSLGVNGQMYFDYTNSVLYGPKTSGAWGTGLSLAATPVSLNGSLRGDIAPNPGTIPFSAATRPTSAGRIYFLRYVPARSRALTLTAFAVTTAAAVNDPVEIGIYSAGSTLTQLATTGQQLGLLNSIGAKTANITYTIDPSQVYYVAFVVATVGGAAGVVAGATSPSAETNLLYGNTQPNALMGVADGQLVGGLLPATVLNSAITWGSIVTCPIIVMREI